LWLYLQNYAAKHKAAGHGLTGENETTRTLTPRYFKDGSEILVDREAGKNPRRLTPRECSRLMGFPDDFKIPVSDVQAYKQFGNASVVPVIREIARTMNPHILETAKKSSDNLDIFLMTDQPETCRTCGVRTNWIDYRNSQQLHTCPSCNYIYLLEECDE
ncbi:MAG: DNA cytosine methyltransferase, partial [Syntrophales bacterium]